MHEKEQTNNDFENSHSEINSLNIKKNVFNDLGKGRKIALVFLTFFSFVFLGVWFYSFNRFISKPFQPLPIGEEENVLVKDDDVALKNKDTDGDGLNDWEEINVYSTSPYLEDSDSDGFTDREEIESNNDPNCPTGKECLGDEFKVTEDEQILIDTVEKFSGLSGNTDKKDELNDLLSGKSDADSIRKLLIEAGMDKSMLEKISDEALIENYNNILSTQNN